MPFLNGETMLANVEEGNEMFRSLSTSLYSLDRLGGTHAWAKCTAKAHRQNSFFKK